MSDNLPNRLVEARNSFTGKRLTNSQFNEAWSIADIMRHTIEKTGSFREKLTDYSQAFARSERFDALKGETIIRDTYQSRYGETLNQTRELLIERNKDAVNSAQVKSEALVQAKRIKTIITKGETKPFYRAYDSAAHTLSKQHDITETLAKEMMQETFREAEGKELYEWGKALEKEHHTPTRQSGKREAADVRGTQKERNRA